MWDVATPCGCRGGACVARVTSLTAHMCSIDPGTLRSSSDSQCPIQILDEIGDVFDPGRKPHQPVTDARRRALLRRKRAVGRQRRVEHHRVDVAEGRHRQADAQRPQEAEDLIAPRVRDVEGDDATAQVALEDPLRHLPADRDRGSRPA